MNCLFGFWLLGTALVWLVSQVAAPASYRGPVLTLPKLRPDQTRIARHPAKKKVVACGRRWGKTFFAGALALASANRGAAVAWVVPTYKNSRPVWRFIKRQVAPLVRSKVVRVSESERTVTFPSGGFIAVYSGDNPDSIRGESFDLVIGDEAARFSPETYFDVLLPTLADRDGTIILLSTPNGLNWFYTEWLAGQDKTQTDIHSWRRPTSDNPIATIRKAYELMRLRVQQGRYPDRTFRQEWDAEFIEDSGVVFRYVNDAAWWWDTDGHKHAWLAPATQPLPGHNYVFGLDWGRTNDFTVLAVLDATTHELVALDRFTALPYQLQITRLSAWVERFAPSVIVAETNAMGGPQVERIQNELGWPVFAFNMGHANKAVLVDRLALDFDSRALRVIPHTELVEELKAYTAVKLPSGLLRYTAPEGMHDDCVVALMLALYGTHAPVVEPADPELVEVLSSYVG